MRFRAIIFAPLLAMHCSGLLPSKRPAPPRLTIVLVVDQMRADYLENYGPLFEGGFARLLDEGAVFTDALQDHAATVTAVGHATIATGVVPARHGTVGNDFFDRVEGRVVRAVGDPSVEVVGAPDSPGISPIRLERSALGDWLRAARPDGRAYSASLKGGPAVLLGGKEPNGAYWYDDETKGLVTSTYYENELPEWLSDFAPGGVEVALLDAVAARELPDGWSDAQAQTPSSAAHEYMAYAGSSFADEVTFRFAEAAIDDRGLGADDVPDLLTLSVSGTDDLGHRFGPYSREVLEYYLQLDRRLGRFFDFLDRRVGAGQWTIALSADHGAAIPPELLLRHGRSARRIPSKEFSSEMRSAVVDVMADSPIEPRPTIRWMDGPHILSEAAPEDLDGLRRALATRFEQIEFVSDAIPADELDRTEIGAPGLAGRFRRSFDARRSPDVLLHLEENHVVGETPGVHGSAYRYDMHVPLIFMGSGVRAGVHERRVRTVDLAPTLAHLMRIEAPSDLDGRVLREVAR